MAVTGTQTNRAICTQALRKIDVVAQDSAATADEIETARLGLRRMLKAWQNQEILLPMIASQSVTLTTAASYTLDPVRPLEIQSCRFKRNDTEIPMIRLSRNEYDCLPNKAATGQPTQFHYDRQKEAAVLYVWPVLSSASGETLEITYTREFADVDLDEDVDFPAEWEDAVVYNLALRLADDFMADVSPRFERRAMEELNNAFAFDREESVFFTSAAFEAS